MKDGDAVCIHHPQHLQRTTVCGSTSDLKQRLADHNAGRSAHTSKYVPWELECYLGFTGKRQAYDFEKYLKSHSGRAFASKRLVRSRTGKTALSSV
ncbi:MAG: GIY-YIG nuclease family protein [Aestuariivirga sp.]